MMSLEKLQKLIDETIAELEKFKPDDKTHHTFALRIRLIWLKSVRDDTP